MSNDSRPDDLERLDAVGRPLEEPPSRPVRERGLLVIIATERPLLLIGLIVVLVAVMTIVAPDTFPRPANAAVVLLDTAQTGILACGMMLLMISGMFDLSIGGMLAFSGIMAGLAAKELGFPPFRRSSSGAFGARCSARSTASSSRASRSTP